MNNSTKLKIEVWSDWVCPFCYIGVTHFEKALSQFEQADAVELEFKSFQLEPDFVQDTENKYNLKESLAHKYHRPIAEIEKMQQHIVEMAEATGLHFDFDKVVRFNTFDAHRLAHKAKEKGVSDKLKENLFAAYFTEGKNLGNADALKQEARNAGLTEADIQQALTDESFAYQVKQDIQEAANLGVTGVPFFVFDRKYGVSGAQPVKVFADTLNTAYNNLKLSQPHTEVNEGPVCDTNNNCN